MKRKVLFVLLLMGGIFAFAQTPVQNPLNVYLYLHWGEKGDVLGSQPRGPEDPLTIGLEDHTLYMSNVDFDVTLQLTDANDNVVYTTFVAANTSTVVLPSTLTGEYKIELIDDERCFWGYIEL